ncbi:hypothetical protein AB1Y20_023579 [Prymnesium parvum]|uniref:Sodium/bile acid cotransporter n=1 Tax=Prymnesium parvum TaxID=97485 RepID=A0AB34JES3_PRYPA|mmetsp:Transcript_38939/g.94577  ORF Transcript_38939/g.94577 Transcript_38939/m.94577 type:complete len:347 (+) Transcript_38939:26-1066(+)
MTDAALEMSPLLQGAMRSLAPLTMLSIGLVSRVPEIKQIFRPSPLLSAPFAAFLVMIALLLLLAPAAVYATLLAANLPPFFKLGLSVVICTPGGLASNVFAVAVGASVELNAVLTLVGTIVSLLLLPAAFTLLAPALLGMPAQQILSPLPLLLANLLSTFVPLPIGFALGNRCPEFTAKLRVLLSPIAVAVVAFILVSLIPTLAEACTAIPLQGLILLALLPLVQFASAYLIGVWMGQPPPRRLSMGLELGLRDVPLASSVALTSFDGLPRSTIALTVAVIQLQALCIVIPILIVAIVRLPMLWSTLKSGRADKAETKQSRECGGASVLGLLGCGSRKRGVNTALM